MLWLRAGSQKSPTLMYDSSISLCLVQNEGFLAGWASNRATAKPSSFTQIWPRYRNIPLAFGFTPSVGLDEGLAEYMAWIVHDPVTLRRLEETQP